MLKPTEKMSKVFFNNSMMLGTITIAVVLSVASLIFSQNYDPVPRQIIESHFKDWFTILEQPEIGAEARDIKLRQIISNLFDFQKFAPQILQHKWDKLDHYQQSKFIEALTTAIKNAVVRHIDKYYSSAVPTLRLNAEKISEKFASLEYAVLAGEKQDKLTIYLLKNKSGVWKINNIKIGKNSIIRYYYGFCENILDDYAIEYLIAELGEYGYVTLEDFEANESNILPIKWNWKKQDKKKHKPYLVKVENGNKFLAATDEGESVIIGKNIKWDIKKYPYISFRWRAHKIPEGADERFNKKIDSAAGIYITYKFKFGLIPESVKYVWSSTLPIGSTLRRSGIGKPWMVVAESGKDKIGEWHTYVFNAYEAYKKTFGGKPPHKASGIGILSDANSMKSFAYADYDDIRALKQADVDSGIKKILKAE